MLTSSGWAVVALIGAIAAFGFAMWASTSEEGAPGWRSGASLGAAGGCVAYGDSNA